MSQAKPSNIYFFWETSCRIKKMSYFCSNNNQNHVIKIYSSAAKT
jgi:hypothetical protein